MPFFSPAIFAQNTMHTNTQCTQNAQSYANTLCRLYNTYTSAGGGWETGGAETFAKGTSVVDPASPRACVSACV